MLHKVLYELNQKYIGFLALQSKGQATGLVGFIWLKLAAMNMVSHTQITKRRRRLSLKYYTAGKHSLMFYWDFSIRVFFLVLSSNLICMFHTTEDRNWSGLLLEIWNTWMGPFCKQNYLWVWVLSVFYREGMMRDSILFQILKYILE